ncbi:hypothetical protein ILUMI_10682 [Ignelater luminosus]|uniref:Uncharacterized protein n=1 Tax=Ignelater luminosus TaxID=2038154 RepID=A0A8K0CXE4_IGNLU|nr:hypothetical protein ILUMI_10682 [Ignelater luminosus]
MGDYLSDDILTKVYTSEGICFSFNMIDPNHLQTNTEKYQNRSATQAKSKGWSLADGYVNEDTTDDFPRRTFVSGVFGGLSISLFTNHSYIDRFCSDDNEGFQVTIHHPAEFPNMNTNFRVPLDQTVSVAIKPTLITVSEELINYKPEDRKCYFSNERNLTYFLSYSQQNCLDECLTNYTMQYCGCVAFYMPKSKSFPICGLGRTDCMEMGRNDYLLDSSNTTDCNCLPSCTSLKYEVEISQSNWAWRESMIVEKTIINNFSDYFSNIQKSHFSKVIVYFKDMQFLALERHAIYGTIDFFSNAGGLLGLCIGFSLTCAIEVIYFLTLRVVCNIKMFGWNFWSGQEVANQK